MQTTSAVFGSCILSLALFLLSGCDTLKSDTSRGQLLAEVGAQQLYATDVEGIVPPGLASADSLQVLTDFIDRWVRDAAVSEEAISQLGDSPDIERLVDQYRTSLARDRYQTKIASMRIDTVVTQEQLEQTYEQSKGGLSAKQTLVQAILVKMPSPVQDKEVFESAWNQLDDPSQRALVKEMAKRHASLTLLDEQTWYSAAEIGVLLPKEALGSIREGSSVAKGDKHVYYLRINQLVNEGELTPLPYVREQLSKIILEQRKAAFLGTFTDEIYQEARTHNRVKIYIGNDQ